MKKLIIFLCTVALVFGVVGTANATLIDDEDGTITQIRNDGSRLMWLRDANLNSGMSWADAMAWADQLEYAGYNDWRLPTLHPINGTDYDWTWSYDGSTDWGYNITNPNNEMSYMFYVELGNLGLYDTSGNCHQSGWGLSNSEPFENLQEYAYWTDVEYPWDPEVFWVFEFNYGEQTTNGRNLFFAWAVRDMEPIPEPATILLLGSGLIGIAGFRKKIRK